ncbi:MAG: hypothetical protein PHW00_02735 [Clostridia bacterium]|nr:hypothetical protein [Clostridia bacterium]
MKNGKFKSHTDLVNSYDNLQKAFTRKCQYVKQLSKLLTDADIPLPTNRNNQLNIDSDVGADCGEGVHIGDVDVSWPVHYDNTFDNDNTVTCATEDTGGVVEHNPIDNLMQALDEKDIATINNGIDADGDTVARNKKKGITAINCDINTDSNSVAQAQEIGCTSTSIDTDADSDAVVQEQEKKCLATINSDSEADSNSVAQAQEIGCTSTSIDTDADSDAVVHEQEKKCLATIHSDIGSDSYSGVQNQGATDYTATNTNTNTDSNDATQKGQSSVDTHIGASAEVDYISGTSSLPPREMDKQSFYNKYPLATLFSDQIEAVLDNPDVSFCNDRKEALLNVCCDKTLLYHALAGDKDFCDYICNNEQIKRRILADYLIALQNNRVAPTIKSGAKLPLCPPQRPTTLNEANRMVKHYIG